MSGSIAELESDFGVDVPDLHRPYIDQLTRPNPDDHRTGDDAPGGGHPRRVVRLRIVCTPKCTIRSRTPTGSSTITPATSSWYIGQNAWLVLHHAHPGHGAVRPARVQHCISHGIVLGSDGQKMSKSLKNYPDVNEVFDRDGADAMRWFLMSSPILRGGNLIVTEQGIRDGVRQVMIPLWNAWYFFSLYANVARGGQGYDGKINFGPRTYSTVTSSPRRRSSLIS